MGKFEYTPDTQEPKPVKQNRTTHGQCDVYGCPRAGHIHTSNWNCRYHHGKNGAALARITLVLKNHGREFDWYERLLNATMVDFAMGDITKDAPYGLEPHKDEVLKQYRVRVKRRIDELLDPYTKEAA